MKRSLLLAAFLLSSIALSAQNCIIVNSEKIFKSLDAYNTAIEQLDNLAQEYQKQVDARFAEVETLYNQYMAQKTTLSASARQSRENAILALEKEAADFQESIFGQEGTLMKRRIAAIGPIQKEVFAAIETYARSVGASAVIDSANNPTLLYAAPDAEHTQQVISMLKK